MVVSGQIKLTPVLIIKEPANNQINLIGSSACFFSMYFPPFNQE